MGIIKNNKNIIAIYRGDRKITSIFKNNLKIFEIKNHPSYLKSAFAYDSFAEDGITDVITNTKYNWSLYGYNYFNFVIKEHYNTIYQIGNYNSLQTNRTREPILKDFKSLLIKCGNILTNANEPFSYTQKPSTNYEYITIDRNNIDYSSNSYYYNRYDFETNEVMYIYIDFNGGSEQSKFLFLNENFEILAQDTFDTFNLSTNEDVGYYNSLLNISFGSYNTSTNPIDFYYQCYCDKFLSIDEIKEIDKYMMSRGNQQPIAKSNASLHVTNLSTTTITIKPQYFSSILLTDTNNELKIPESSDKLEHNFEEIGDYNINYAAHNDLTSFESMFNGVMTLYKIDVSGFNTSNLTSTKNMFTNTQWLEEIYNINTWYTGKLTNIYEMFSYSAIKKIDLSGWDSSNITNMYATFMYLTFCTEIKMNGCVNNNVTDAFALFGGSSKLERLEIDSFTPFSEGCNVTSMFYGCDKLNYIKCTEAFRNWCYHKQDDISLPTQMREGGGAIWDIV